MPSRSPSNRSANASCDRPDPPGWCAEFRGDTAVADLTIGYTFRDARPERATNLPMARLPSARVIDGSSSGTGYFLCARKERRTGRSGPFLVLVLQDGTGDIDAKVFQDVDQVSQQFEAGE